jgi:hypothetical protein
VFRKVELLDRTYMVRTRRARFELGYNYCYRLVVPIFYPDVRRYTSDCALKGTEIAARTFLERGVLLWYLCRENLVRFRKLRDRYGFPLRVVVILSDCQSRGRIISSHAPKSKVEIESMVRWE